MALCRVARVGLPARLRANFGAMWAWRRRQQPTKMPGCIFVVRFALRSPDLAFARTVELGNTLGVGRVADRADGYDRGAQGLH